MNLIARVLLIIGGLIFVTGGVFYIAPELLSWFGSLPGDLRIQMQNTRIFIPLTSMALISIVLSQLLSVLKKSLHRGFICRTRLVGHINVYFALQLSCSVN